MTSVGLNLYVRSSEYQREMRAAVEETKRLSSEVRLATAQAKLFGDGTKNLEAKQQALTANISGQTKVTEAHTKEVKRLTEVLATLKTKQTEIKDNVDKATEAHKKQAKATGENSDEAEALKTELEKLTKELSGNEASIMRTEKALSDATTEQNKSKAATMQMEAELKKLNEQLRDQALDKFAYSLEKAGKKAEKFGKSMTLAVTTPIVTAITASGKAAIDFESAFAGVRKTVNATEEEFEALADGIRNMSEEIPVSASNIAELAESAGQLGIKTENILDFTRVVADLGVATNIVGQEGAAQIARFANITGMSQADFDKFGSSIVALGNNFATTEAEILAMSMRLAGAGAQVGMSEYDILGLATALSSVGIEAEMGGSAISKVLVNMSAAGATSERLNGILKLSGISLRDLQMLASHDADSFGGLAESFGMTKKELTDLMKQGTNLENFAKISGMTANGFKAAFEDDAVGALQSFIGGLANAEDAGSSAIEMLQEMGVTEVRLRDSLLRAANAGDLLTSSVKLSGNAWQENNALTTEAEQRYATVASQIDMAKNQLVNLGADIGTQLMPHVLTMLNGVSAGVEYFRSLSVETKETILMVSGIAATVGPATLILGKMATGVSAGVKAFRDLRAGASLLNVVLAANPIGFVVIAIAALVAGFVIAYRHCEGFRNIVDGTFNAIKNIVGNTMQAAKNAVQEKFDNIRNAYEQNGGGLKGIAAATMEGIKGYWTLGFSFIDNLTGNKLTAVKDSFSNKLTETKQSVFEKFGSIKQTMDNTMQSAKDAVQQKLNNIKSAYEQNGGGLKGIAAATMESIKSYWSLGFSFIDTLTGGKLTIIRDYFSNKLNEALSIVYGILNSVKNAFDEKMEAASQAVYNAIEKIKSFFNFTWSLPEIKLPHFEIEGRFSLSPPRVPSFSVEWYRSGGIMTQPTMFGMAGTRVLAGGEAGAEAILPLVPFYVQLSQLLDEKIQKYLQQTQVNVEAHCYIDGDEVSSKTYQRTSEKLVTDYKKRR